MFLDLLGKPHNLQQIPSIILIDGTTAGVGKSSFAHYFRQSNVMLHQHRIIHLDQYLDDRCNGSYKIDMEKLSIIKGRKVIIEGLLGKDILESINVFPDLHFMLDKSHLIKTIDEYKYLSAEQIAQKEFLQTPLPEFQLQVFQYLLELRKAGYNFDFIHQKKIYKFPCPNSRKPGMQKNTDIDAEGSESNVSDTKIYIGK